MYINKSFLDKIITNHLKKNNKLKIITRFPPEPNGYLHIGHIKAIFINYYIAHKYNGKCILRFDDTNPNTEKKKYVQSILKNLKWLGFNFNKITYTSNYFKQYYKYAIQLIYANLAYIEELNQKEIKIYKGTYTTSGINSPYRNRTIKENLKLFKQMRKGFYKEGTMCLRAKINMSSPNILLRDPILYRIKYKKHYKTSHQWCIYPMYDYAHCIADYLEHISHSFCTSEFINNKDLYIWILNHIKTTYWKPQQYEFTKLNLTYTLTSKRQITQLIKKKIINKWDDPRLMTISGMKNRGYTKNSILKFCSILGISKQDNIINLSILENILKKELNQTTPRSMAVLKPIKIILVNLKKTFISKIKIPVNPSDKNSHKHYIYLTPIIYIEKNDITKILSTKVQNNINKSIKLKYTGFIKILFVKKYKKNNNIKYIKCFFYMKKKYNKKNIHIIHWISEKYALKTKFYLFRYLFNSRITNVTNISNISQIINQKSILKYIGYTNILHQHYNILQFERIGYFKINNNTLYNKPYQIYNRILSL